MSERVANFFSRNSFKPSRCHKILCPLGRGRSPCPPQQRTHIPLSVSCKNWGNSNGPSPSAHRLRGPERSGRGLGPTQPDQVSGEVERHCDGGVVEEGVHRLRHHPQHGRRYPGVEEHVEGVAGWREGGTMGPVGEKNGIKSDYPNIVSV